MIIPKPHILLVQKILTLGSGRIVLTRSFPINGIPDNYVFIISILSKVIKLSSRILVRGRITKTNDIIARLLFLQPCYTNGLAL